MSHRSKNHPRDVVIVNSVRTPLCRARRGAFASTPPSTLLSAVLRGVLASKPAAASLQVQLVPPSAIEDVCVGNVLSPASGAAAMRMAQLAAGLPHTTPLSTVNRQCSSGLQACANIANAIASGQIDIGIGCGVESMSTHPMNRIPPPDVDWDEIKAAQAKLGNEDSMDCLIPMGITSENVSKTYKLDRRSLDEFAAESHRRAHAAKVAGKFIEEIVPVTLPDGTVVTEDDGIRPGTTAGGLAKLRPAFDPQGSTTAGNSSQLTDGAAAVLMMSRAEAEKRGLPILAIWRSYSVVGVPPNIMGVGPAYAIPSALAKAGVGRDEVEVYEINEAFASQASWSVKELGLTMNKVNPNGGAIALGHPLGCTGARQMATLLHELHRRKGDRSDSRSQSMYGVVSMCIGTGMGAAAVVEVPSMVSKL
mmetsp:Transcript_13034/g.26942  ORF Transcript_13034/g.26942 Transcript_13034/m.26942 type:complete len:421 (+) Transcript_13034:116-1378(+)